MSSLPVRSVCRVRANPIPWHDCHSSTRFSHTTSINLPILDEAKASVNCCAHGIWNFWNLSPHWNSRNSYRVCSHLTRFHPVSTVTWEDCSGLAWQALSLARTGMIPQNTDRRCATTSWTLVKTFYRQLFYHTSSKSPYHLLVIVIFIISTKFRERTKVFSSSSVSSHVSFHLTL